MCGRFGSSFDARDLTDQFDLSQAPPDFFQSYNIAPSFTIPIIIKNSPNKAVLARWGFIPQWVKDPNTMKMKPINARDDKVFESGFYKTAIAHGRCLVPFSFFYEWKRITLDGKPEKHPYLIRVKGEKVMGFAGIYSEIKDAEGLPIRTCAIITTKPNELMKKIHNRMPVIIERKKQNTWINNETDLKIIKELMRPYDSNKMESYEVSKAVNSPKNDSPDLVKPVDSIL